MNSSPPISLDTELQALLSSYYSDFPQDPWFVQSGFLNEVNNGHDESHLQPDEINVDDGGMALDGFDFNPHLYETASLASWLSQPMPDHIMHERPQSREGQRPTPPDIQAMQTKFSVRRRTYVPPLTTESWKSQKSQLRRLYIDEDRPLKEIMDIMGAKNFKASAKMYKSRFKQWGFVKNNRREDITRMLQVRRQRAAAGKPTTFKRNGKSVKIEDYLRKNGYVLCHLPDPDSPGDLPEFVRCYTPRLDAVEDLRPPEHHRLKELMLICLKDLPPSFTKISRSNSGKPSPNIELWDTPRYLKMACELFAERRHSQAGSICRSAFGSVHNLVYPPRLDTLFNFLFSQLWWRNRDITLEVWRYLAAYTCSISGPRSQFHQLFRALSEHVQNHGYDTYLDFVADCIDDILCIKHNAPITRHSDFVGWCQLIVLDASYMNGKNGRAERLQTRCIEILPRSRLFPLDRKLNKLLWHETFTLHTRAQFKQSRHDRFLKLAFLSYAKLLDASKHGNSVKPTCLLARIEGCIAELSSPNRNPTGITKFNRNYTLETNVLQFLARDPYKKSLL